MGRWHKIQYIQDYDNLSGFIADHRKAGEVDTVTTDFMDKLVGLGVAQEIFDNPEKSVAFFENLSDNKVMSPTSTNGMAFPLTTPSIAPFPFSPQQDIVFSTITDDTGHHVVIAVAGSGKTTTLIEHFRRIVRLGQKVVFLAFNKKIADEIQAKVNAIPGMSRFVKIRTFHAYGMGIWMKANRGCKVEGEGPNNAGYLKFNRIIEELEVALGEELPYMYRSFVRRAWQLARQGLFGYEINLMDKAKWLELVDHYDLDEEIAEVAYDDGLMLSMGDLQDHVFKAINWTVRVIRRGIEIAHEVIDFEDMIYMPLVAQVRVELQDWVLVDEAQDSNSSRRAFVAKILKPSGRTVWVGDPHQAIYGFTGANHDSIEIIKHRFGAKELPLTVSFRCTKSGVRLAKTWVSHIEAHENAIEGSSDRTIRVEDILSEKLNNTHYHDSEGNLVLMKDVILCRNNKPIVDLALALLRKGIPCHVEGQDIVKSLLRLVTRWKSVQTLDELTVTLEEYREEQVEKAMARGKEQKASNIADQVDTVLAIISDMPRGSSIDQLQSKIEDIFMDQDRQMKPMLTLSTIHKSKGREWDRVFWYGRHQFQPSKYARQDWQMQQEHNLCYVAATRSKNILVTVNPPTETGSIRFKEAPKAEF